MSEEPPIPAAAAPPPNPQEEEAASALRMGQMLALRRMAAARRESRQTGRRLFNFSLVGSAAILVYVCYNAQVADPVHLYLGGIMFALAVAPALIWARKAQYGLPVFEAFMLPGANTFALPLLNGKEQLRIYSPDTITVAALAVILFQVTALATFYGIKAPPKRGRVWRTEIMSESMSRLIGYGMIVTTIYTVVVQFYGYLIPSDITPEVRAACYGIGIVATFIQAQRLGQNSLKYYDRIIFVVQLALQVLFSWVALFLVQGVTIMIIALIGYVAGSRRIPIVTIAVCLPIIGVLYSGKSQMRTKYWDSHAPQPTLFDVPSFFEEWVQDGLTASKGSDAGATAGVLDRTSLIQIMCLVVSISPDHKPFLDGETYAQIPAQFIPRFFWPDKPLGHISTFTLNLYYGMQQTMEEAQQTTIGFGMVAEAYANFGFFGMALLGFAFGLLFKKATGWASESPVFSYPGLFLIVLIAWTFDTEVPLSAWLASLWQACICVLGIPMVLKNFFK